MHGRSRVFYLDLLLIFSIFAMILLHVCSRNFHLQDIRQPGWMTLNVYDSTVRFCVPAFIMISGVFFVDPKKPLSIKKLFSKNILRLVAAFAFWSAVYTLFSYFYLDYRQEPAQSFINGRYHLPFIFELVSLYLLAPLLRHLMDKKNLTRYYLILILLFGFIVPILIQFNFLPTSIFLGKINRPIFWGYIGYFILGYLLHQCEISKKIMLCLIGAGILSTIFTALATQTLSIQDGKANTFFYSYTTINVLLQSIGVFVLFKLLFQNSDPRPLVLSFTRTLAGCSFGMYLSHDIFNIIFAKHGLHNTSFDPIFSVPVVTILVFICSFCLSWLINKIPLIRKWIV